MCGKESIERIMSESGEDYGTVAGIMLPDILDSQVGGQGQQGSSGAINMPHLLHLVSLNRAVREADQEEDAIEDPNPTTRSALRLVTQDNFNEVENVPDLVATEEVGSPNESSDSDGGSADFGENNQVASSEAEPLSFVQGEHQSYGYHHQQQDGFRFEMMPFFLPPPPPPNHGFFLAQPENGLLSPPRIFNGYNHNQYPPGPLMAGNQYLDNYSGHGSPMAPPSSPEGNGNGNNGSFCACDTCMNQQAQQQQPQPMPMFPVNVFTPIGMPPAPIQGPFFGPIPTSGPMPMPYPFQQMMGSRPGSFHASSEYTVSDTSSMWSGASLESSPEAADLHSNNSTVDDDTISMRTSICGEFPTWTLMPPPPPQSFFQAPFPNQFDIDFQTARMSNMHISGNMNNQHSPLAPSQCSQQQQQGQQQMWNGKRQVFGVGSGIGTKAAGNLGNVPFYYLEDLKTTFFFNGEELPYVVNTWDPNMAKKMTKPPPNYEYYVPPKMDDFDFFGGQHHMWQVKMMQKFGKYRPDVWRLQAVPDFRRSPSDGWFEFNVTAKLRFCCRACKTPWTSKQGKLVFGFFYNPNENRGWIFMKMFGQVCMQKECKDWNFQTPACYPEEIDRAIHKLSDYIGHIYYALPVSPFIFTECQKSVRPGTAASRNPKNQKNHRKELCQACQQGICQIKPMIVPQDAQAEAIIC